jgi:hypothetical protein
MSDEQARLVTCKWCQQFEGSYLGIATVTKNGKTHKYRSGYQALVGERFKLWTVCGFKLHGQG